MLGADSHRIVEESLAPGTSVVEVAQRHDVHRSLLTVWRRQARAGVLACGSEPVQRQDDGVRFAAVSIAPDRQPLTAPSGTSGTIEIEFAAEARMRITGAVDAATLTALVAALQRQYWAPLQNPLATIALRIVDIPLSWFNDELLDRIDLSPCVPSGPPRTLASPLLTTALAPVRLDRFGACRRSRAARRAWWRDRRRSG